MPELLRTNKGPFYCARNGYKRYYFKADDSLAAKEAKLSALRDELNMYKNQLRKAKMNVQKVERLISITEPKRDFNCNLDLTEFGIN